MAIILRTLCWELIFIARFLLICFIFLAVTLRLQGPSSATGTGRVEVFYNGQWGTICNDYWTVQDAEVACRQLGYQYAVRTLPSYLVPDGTGKIWLDNVGCRGHEQSLSTCYHLGWGVHNCRHSGDAGVECSSAGIVFIMIMNLRMVLRKKNILSL